MGSTKDKIKGYANEAMGNVKQAVGKAIDSESLEAEGVAQRGIHNRRSGQWDSCER